MDVSVLACWAGLGWLYGAGLAAGWLGWLSWLGWFVGRGLAGWAGSAGWLAS